MLFVLVFRKGVFLFPARYVIVDKIYRGADYPSEGVCERYHGEIVAVAEIVHTEKISLSEENKAAEREDHGDLGYSRTAECGGDDLVYTKREIEGSYKS